MSRTSAYPIEPLLLNRWSPRALSGEAIPTERLMALFEAARWAPSSYNAQPWRFLYAVRDSAHWQKFFDLMVPFNQSWAKNAAVLVVVISKKTFEHNGEASVTHGFDAGAAWENLALQASASGLVAHGMQGFDYEAARRTLNVPDDYEVHAMIAIGVPGRMEDLPAELREREAPSDRRPLEEIVMEGGFRS